MNTMLLLAIPTALAGAPPPIVGGTPVPDGRWAETAAIYQDGDVACTGVLISPSWVLTAGHCTSDAAEAVYLGGNDLGDLAEGEWFEIVDAIPYPQYWEAYDVGLLALDRSAEQQPPEVALDCALEELSDGALAQIVGYGAIDEYGTRYTDDLMEATVGIHDADCDDLDLGCEPAVSPGGELSAGGDGTDTCYGDSGGPLFLWTSYGVPALQGLTSRGTDSEGPPCATGGIYVRVDAVADWIESATLEELRRPTCEPAENHAPEPTADDLTLLPGTTGATQVHPGDPDPHDSHTFTLTVSPLLGTATLGGTGLVTYSAFQESLGTDTLEVQVDDGELFGSVLVTVFISEEASDTGEEEDTGQSTPDESNCGCSSQAGTWAWLWLPLALGLATRSRHPGVQRTGRL